MLRARNHPDGRLEVKAPNLTYRGEKKIVQRQVDMDWGVWVNEDGYYPLF